MTTPPQDPRARLREALAEVGRVVERLVDVLDEPAGPTVPAEAELSGAGARALEALGGELARATGLVTARAGHAAWSDLFGADGWSAREVVLRQALEADLDAGTARWFDTWLAALSAGAWEEAWRVLGLPCRLADWAVWLPDRAAVVQQALETATTDPVRSAEQVGNLVEVLSDYRAGSSDHVLYGTLERLGDDSVAGRINLVLLVGRLLALAGDPRAVPLVGQSRRLLGAVRSGSEASLGRAIIATESFLERHGQGADRAGQGEAVRAGTPSDLAGIHEFIERHRASSDPTESSDESAGEAAEHQLVTEVQAMVDALGSVAGCAERLRTLLEAPSDELVLALATRLAREQQLGLASELSQRLWIPALVKPLRLPAAELAVTIADGRSLGADEIAEVVALAGDQALWGGDAETAARHYSRSLELRPGVPETLRSLADALQVGAARKDPQAAVRDLRRALDLCKRAALVEPVTESTSWAVTLLRQVHQQLSVLEPGHRSEHLWEALGSTAEALRAAPAHLERWSLLVDDLTVVGLCHTAHLAALHHRAHVGPTPESDRQVVMTLINTGRSQEALRLIEQLVPEPEEDPGWLDGLRGYAHSMLDHDDDAQTFFALARTASPLLMYKEWAAAHLTRHESPDAEPLWQAIWKDSRLDDMDEVGMAASAALYQRLFASARELSTRLAPAERLIAGIRTSAVSSGVVDVVLGAEREGWATLEAAFDSALVLQDLLRAGQLARAMLRRSGVADTDRHVNRLDQVVALAQARLELDVPGDDPVAAQEAELVWVPDHLHDPVVSRVVALVAGLMQAVDTGTDTGTTAPALEEVGSGDAPSPPAEPSAEDDPIVVVMPPSWFVEWEGRETEHEFFVHGLPFARAAVRRTGRNDVASRAVRVQVDAACEPDRVWVQLAGGVRTLTGVDTTRWYCPREWATGQRSSRHDGVEESRVAGLLTVPEPDDATDRLSSWSSAETVARLVLGAAVEERAESHEPDVREG